MLVHLKEILTERNSAAKAVGAFNTFNLETTKGIVKGAVEANLSAIIQTTEKAIAYAGLKNLFNLITSVVEEESGHTLLALHLDHGKDLTIIRECLKIGYSSVHCDASAYSFEANIKITKEAAQMAHQHGALVQGELGNILGKEGLLKMQQGVSLEKLLTPPEQIAEYLERTGVDTIAVSLGNLHGNFVGQEKLDLERLRQIQAKISTPIVLHGGSGISDPEIRLAIGFGVRIINVDTDLRIAFTNALKQSLAIEKDSVDPREPLEQATNAIAAVVKAKIKLFNLN